MRALLLPLIIVLGCLASIGSRVAADEATIRAMVAKYVTAFNAKDADIVASMWAEDASHVDHAIGQRTTGRDAIMVDINEAFADAESRTLSGSVDEVRMITDSVANIRGTVSVVIGEGEPIVNPFSAIVIEKDGTWQIESMDEMAPVVPATPTANLDDLSWLIGSWEDVAGEAPVQSVVRAAVGGKFLVRAFKSSGPTGELLESTQVIGWDPRSRQIRSWTFSSEGSFGEAVWMRSGEKWVIETVQTLGDGRAATGTFVITPEDHDTFTAELTNVEIEGEPQPAMPAMKVRRKAESAETTPATEGE